MLPVDISSSILGNLLNEAPYNHFYQMALHNQFYLGGLFLVLDPKMNWIALVHRTNPRTKIIKKERIHQNFY